MFPFPRCPSKRNIRKLIFPIIQVLKRSCIKYNVHNTIGGFFFIFLVKCREVRQINNLCGAIYSIHNASSRRCHAFVLSSLFPKKKKEKLFIVKTFFIRSNFPLFIFFVLRTVLVCNLI